MHILVWFFALTTFGLVLALPFCRAARSGDEALELPSDRPHRAAVDLLRYRLQRQARTRA